MQERKRRKESGMGTIAGRSAGFGRIRGEVRPSPFTPVHLPSTPLASAMLPPAAARSRVAVSVVVALVVAAVAFVVGVVAKARPGPATAPILIEGAAPVLDAEAERLGRSAFARQRREAG
jgi:hypothetical protein